MSNQAHVEAADEIVAEMQYLLGVADVSDESPEAAEAEVIGSLKGLND